MDMSQRMWRREQERRKRQRIRRAKQRRACTVFVFAVAIIAVVVIVAVGNRTDGSKEQSAPASASPMPVDTSVITDVYTTNRAVEDIKSSYFKNSAFAGNAVAHSIGTYGILKETDFYTDVNADVENVYTIKPAGSTTSMAEQFKSKKFKKVFLSFGEKELANEDAGKFKTDYRALIRKIKEYQKNASIYLIAIPPVTADVSDGAVSGITMKNIKEYNKQIKSLAAGEDVYYIDSLDALGDNKGYLPKGVSCDGISLNKAAVIDLVYYASKEAYKPTSEDISKNDENDKSDEVDTDDEDTENESADDKDEGKKDEKSTPKPTDEPTSSPEPTVNVLKDTAETRKNKEE